ncbi:MAG: hypothetical protein AAFP85_13110 [Pseudomonadota bacterium]
MSNIFRPVDDLTGIHIARHGKLNAMAVQLNDGTLCIYSPIAGLARAARDDLQETGDISVLLAPNHYHNKGLKEHVDHFAGAALVCSEAAAPRLAKVTGLGFSDIRSVAKMFPDGVRIFEPAGLKTGEVWLQIIQGEHVVWIVTDAFSAPLLPVGQYADAPTLLGTFPKYGLQDGKAFKSWVAKQVSIRAPTILLPCHGSPVRGPNLGGALQELLAERL